MLALLFMVFGTVFAASFNDCRAAYINRSLVDCDVAWCQCSGAVNVSISSNACQHVALIRTSSVFVDCSALWASCARRIAVPACDGLEGPLCRTLRPGDATGVVNASFVNTSLVCNAGASTAAQRGCVASSIAWLADCSGAADRSVSSVCGRYDAGLAVDVACADRLPTVLGPACSPFFSSSTPARTSRAGRNGTSDYSLPSFSVFEICRAAGFPVRVSVTDLTLTPGYWPAESTTHIVSSVVAAIAGFAVVLVLAVMLLRWLSQRQAARYEETYRAVAANGTPPSGPFSADPRGGTGLVVRSGDGALQPTTSLAELGVPIGGRGGTMVYKVRVGEVFLDGNGVETRVSALKKMSTGADTEAVTEAMDAMVVGWNAHGTPTYLRSKHLNHVSQVVSDVGGLLIASDYIPAVSILERVLCGGPLSEQISAGICRDVLHGLMFLHAHGLAHGDLKPSNIFCHQGRGVLTDYSFVPFLARVGIAPQRTYYPSGRWDSTADVAAVGFLALELLTGAPAFKHLPDFGRLYCAHPDGAFPLPPPAAVPYAAARAFIGACTAPIEGRPTAAELLGHPWLYGLPPRIALTDTPAELERPSATSSGLRASPSQSTRQAHTSIITLEGSKKDDESHLQVGPTTREPLTVIDV
eukprot:TRINITY_DN582_c0_g2_i1.p1 TRINITY_DN582_c0_g2~~TRINITY_DN582_c0_g2_i1.p1  ORF type:complete len:678 (+),score=23.80 TRINITY_DN582_c0_g2_i1:111-2036(+)